MVTGTLQLRSKDDRGYGAIASPPQCDKAALNPKADQPISWLGSRRLLGRARRRGKVIAAAFGLGITAPMTAAWIVASSFVGP